MKLSGRNAFPIIAIVFLCAALSAPSSATMPSSSLYRLSFVIQPSDILAGASLFATTVLTHPTKNLISSNAVQFQIFDSHNRPVPGTSVLPVTTDSRGLAIFADTVLQPGKKYTLVASCADVVIRSRPFDVIAPEPQLPIVTAPVMQPRIASAPPAAAPDIERDIPEKNPALPAKKSKSVVIPNPNPGRAREMIAPPVVRPRPSEPKNKNTDRVVPLRVLPAAFDLVLSAPPGTPQDVEIRVIAIPNPALSNPDSGAVASGSPF